MRISKLHIYWTAIVLLSLTEVIGQSYTINEVELTGIIKNNETYLRNFIEIDQNRTLDLEEIDIIRQRLIRNTGISNVEFRIDTIGEYQVNITFDIEEQKTLRPQLGIGRIQGNFWWQVGLAEYNLGGKEHTLIGTYLSNDKQPNFQVYYENKRAKGSQWGYAIDINRQSSIEPLYFPTATVVYKYANIGAGTALFYNIDFNKRITLGANIFQEDYSKNDVRDIATTPGPSTLTENKLLFKAQYEDNRLFYDYFYRTGYQFAILAQTVNNIDVNSQFVAVSFEGTKFWRPWSGGNIAVKLRAALATNTPSPFAPFVLDSKTNIRGVGNRVDRGTAQLVLNLEYRHTVFHNDKFAGQVVTFADLGTWRNPGGELKELFDSDIFREFVGVGVRFINKRVFQSTLRLDYGVDITDGDQRGFVFGVGQYF